jgi:twinkle protein
MALSPKHVEILEARGLDVELLVRHGVDACDRPTSGLCVVIPFKEAGQIVNRKYRSIDGDKRFMQDKDAKKVFWNVDVIADETLKDRPLIITEGEFDALAAIQCGFARTVSVPDGAPAQQIGDNATAKYTFLDNAPQALKDVEEIIIAADGDEAGANLLHDLALRLGKARCKWVKYPRGCKDLNDALRLYGPKGVTETIARAQWVRVDGIYRMPELPPLPYREPHRIGLRVLDDHYRLRLGDFTALTGIPSHGKSTFAREVSCRMALNFGWPTAMAAFEEEVQTDVRYSLRTWFNKKPAAMQSAADVARADAWIERMFTFIVPSEDDEVTLAWTLEKCSTAVIRNGVKLVIIDPWNQMDHSRPAEMSLTEYTGFAIKQFAKFARKHLVHVMVVAHPAKQRKLETGEYGIPSLYDISDSAHWYNRADVGLVVHQSKEGTILRVAKSRNHREIGRPGDVPIIFNPDIGRFEVADTEEVGRAWATA